MLLLSRKIGEVIEITTPDGHVVEVMPTRIIGRRVVLGTKADRSIRVRRKELPPERKAEARSLK